VPPFKIALSFHTWEGGLNWFSVCKAGEKGLSAATSAWGHGGALPAPNAMLVDVLGCGAACLAKTAGGSARGK